MSPAFGDECHRNLWQVESNNQPKSLPERCFATIARAANRRRLDTRDTSRAQPSTYRSEVWEEPMVAKCANPTCSATFRYLHEGELYAVEFEADSRGREAPADPEYFGNLHACEYFWLCSSCCRTMRVQSDGNHGIILVPKRKMPLAASAMEDSPSVVA